MDSPKRAASFCEKPFWLDTVEMPTADASQAWPESVDAAVIGAGYTGLSAARQLARRGVRVAVLEAETIGWGASSRNGGMVLTGLKLPVEKLIARYGAEITRRMYAASHDSVDYVERLVREESIACDFHRCGHLEVAWKPAHFDGFRRTADLIAKEFHHELRIVPRSELCSEIGSGLFHGGMVDEVSAGLNPARYVAGLARAVARAGAAVFEHARVERVERAARHGAPGFRLQTARGTLWARNVLVATSGYTGRATPALQRKIIPIGSYIIATEPLGETLARQLSPRNRMIYDTKNFLYYFRLTADRRMLFGGRAAFFPETRDSIRRSAEILRRAMVSVYPKLRETKVEYAWGGTLDFAFDIMPHAGELDGLYFSLGYAGHGVAMATYLGAKIAARMCGEREEIPFAAIPFPGAPLGLYRGTPWFLPFAGAWYKFLDWVS